MAIHSSGQTISNLAHIEGITLSEGEEVDEVAGGTNGMGVDISNVSLPACKRDTICIQLKFDIIL